MRVNEATGFLKETFRQWGADKASRLGAALSYYSIFSIGPLLVIAIGIAGMVLGSAGAQAQMTTALEGTLGVQGAEAIATMIAAAAPPGGGLIATVVGVALLIFAASGVIVQLQDALDTVWGVEPAGGGLMATVRKRGLAALVVVGAGLLLLASVALSTAVSAFAGALNQWIPGGAFLAQVGEILVSFAVLTAAFAVVFKVLPDAVITWKDTLVGAATTAALFVAGKFALGLYFAYAAPGSAYGAAGAFVALLVWIYYSAQIFFLGAEMTQVYANRYGGGIRPAENARFVTGIERERKQPERPLPRRY